MSAEEFSLDANYPYQIILDCSSNEPAKIDKKLFSWTDGNTEITSKELSFAEYENKVSEIEVFESQKTAGNSVRLNKSSSLDIKFEREDWNYIYTEFWLKSDIVENKFFAIEKGNNRDTILSFFANKFGFISFPIDENEIERNDIYLGSDWNYIGVLLHNEVSGLSTKVFVNSELAYSTFDEDNFDLEKLDVGFLNISKENSFEIDRLKIWDCENDLGVAQKNKHFLSYEAENSSIIFQSNFDNVGEFNSRTGSDDLKLFYNNLEYVKSDAPLYSKAPSLTVNVGSSYNSIVWYVQEYSVAEEFEIERSLSGGEYQTVYSTLADDDPLRIYYFTDELINEREVAYYRVKQINQDGSEVYSAEVKIGNKEIQEFNLSQNYPNPFNPITSIYVEVIIPTEFEVRVYDLVGNTVANLYDGYLAEGLHTFEFDGSSLPSGIYFYEVVSPKSQSVKKMILAK
jgi:hypothetical protein